MVLGSRTATILPRLTFSIFFFAIHSSAHCPNERAGGRLPVVVELLLGARVFAFLEQVFGLVTLSPRVGERERAILAAAVRADGVGFPAGVEAGVHPQQLGGGGAGPARVRRDEEIETAAGHVGDLGGTPRAVVEFRSR